MFLLSESQPHRHSPAVPCIPIDLAMYEPGTVSLPLRARVHKLMDRKHWVGNQAAMEAIQSEKGGLLQEGAWDESSIMDHPDLIAWAKRGKVTIHVGSIMVIVSVKGFEREPSKWKLKARIVFRGDAVSDQNGLGAVFQDLAASAPSSIAGLNFVIGYGQFVSHKCSTADAIKAYIQSNLQTEVPTWVLLPLELVPARRTS